MKRWPLLGGGILVGASLGGLVLFAQPSARSEPSAAKPAPPAAIVRPTVPLTTAIPSPPPPPPPPSSSADDDPNLERQREHARIEATGRAYEAWTRGAGETFTAWRPVGRQGPIAVTFGPTECFQRGCVTTATYADFAAFNALNEAFPESEPFQKWPGGKMRTPPERLADGRLVADWILLPPQGESP